MSNVPFVSVVTPFYNTASYLGECIESVLRQTFTNFEYLLVNNKSTDGSREIAAEYASRDRRITLYDTAEFYPQVVNFNHALRRISPRATYVKLVLADDLILPECLERMVIQAEANQRVGLVSSYYLQGDRVDGSGIPLHISTMSGREALRTTFLTPTFLVGSPSTVMYRADIVRSRSEFYRPGAYHPDTRTAYETLLEHDFGFVHQVLSFIRTDNESVSSAVRDLYPIPLDWFVAFHIFGAKVLDSREYREVRDRVREEYFSLLGRMALRFKGRRFWDYHRRGLASAGIDLHWTDVMPWAITEFARKILNPEDTMRRGLRRWLNRSRKAGPSAGITGSPSGQAGEA